MRIINDEQAVTVTLETILLFTITVMMLGMVMISFQNINERASEVVMREQYASIGNDVASKIIDMDIEVKASLSEDSVVEIRKEINFPPLIADRSYEVEISEDGVIVRSATNPPVTVIVPLDPDVNVAVGSKVHSMVAEHALIYEHNGQIMFENGGVEAISDSIWPTISFLAPNNGAILSDVETITVLALDNLGISRVEYYVDGYYQTTVSDSPYSWEWNTYSISDGTYTVAAMVYDRAGHYSSDTRTYVIDNGVDSVPPTGKIVSPLNGTITDYNPLLIEAIVSDNIAIDYNSIEIWLVETGNNTWINVTSSATITNTSLTKYNIQYLPPNPLLSETYEVYVNASELFYGSGDPENKNVSLHWEFTIIPITDITNPTLSIDSPLNAGYLVVGENVEVGYAATDNAAGDSGIDFMVINYTYNGTDVYTHRENISTYPIVVDAITNTWQFDQLYIGNGSYEYNVTVYDRAGNSAYAEIGPFIAPFGQAADLVVDNKDVDTSVKIIEFTIRSSGPLIEITGMDVTFTSSKLTGIYFSGVPKWSSGAGILSMAKVTFSPYPVPTSNTATKLTFKADPGDIHIKIYFGDGSSIDVDVINVV
ncbi:MAG: Ig-like domain-containing protein [ANME-2 cluster archaeon]|nr:Ig-like domain-containing protein [ANME-2 cluster archaeon]